MRNSVEQNVEIENWKSLSVQPLRPDRKLGNRNLAHSLKQQALHVAIETDPGEAPRKPDEPKKRCV